MANLQPITPGELLLEEFLKPMGISQYRLAKEIKVDVNHERRYYTTEPLLSEMQWV